MSSSHSVQTCRNDVIQKSHLSELSVSKVSVFIAESSRMGCQLMLAALQRSRYGLAAIGFATNSSEALECLNAAAPDVAVISTHLRDGAAAGLKVAREIQASHSKTRVIMVLDSIEETIVVESFRSGASGVFCREEPFELLCKSIHAVHRGQIWANSEAMRFAINALARTPADEVQPDLPKGRFPLTERERSVVQLVMAGLTNRDISRQLNLSEHTVRNYLFRIFNKVGASSRLELAVFAMGENRDNHALPH